MPIAPAEAIKQLPFATRALDGFAAKPSEIECEVVRLFEEFRGSVLRYVLSFGLPLHDGEEVTQEIFLALFRHLQLGKSRRNLRGWIFCVAHNLALKQRYANRRSRDATIWDKGMTENKLDPYPNPEQQVLSSERQRRLWSILQALPEQDRCCLHLRAEGLRYREIAQALGISLGSVSASLARSLTKLMSVDEG